MVSLMWISRSTILHLVSALMQVKMARHLRLLTFDITNTIIAVKQTAGYWYAEAAHEVGIESDVTKLDQVAGPVRKELTAEFPHYGYHLGLNPKEWWTELIMRTFKAAGYDHDPLKYQLIGEILYFMFEGKKCYDVLPGSHSMLEKVKEKDFSIGIISNFDERLPRILQEHNLIDYFDFIVSSATALYEKPDPRIFYDALRKTRMKPGETAHIGDDIVKDYWGAKNAGFQAFLYDPKRKLKDSQLEGVDLRCVYHDHEELPALLGCG